MSPRSKYELSKLANRVFTNRDSAIAQFNNLRSFLLADSHKIWNIYGVGGQGKSALRNHFCRLLSSESSRQHQWGVVDFHQANLREPAAGLFQLRKSFSDNGKISFLGFDVAIAVYWEKAFPGEDISVKLKDLLSKNEDAIAGAVDAAPEWMGLAEELPSGIGLAVKLLNRFRQKARTTYAESIVEDLKGIESLGPHQLLLRLPSLFGNDLRRHREKTKLISLVFLDTFEDLTASGPITTRFADGSADAWVRELIAASPGVLFVVSGRDRLQWDTQYRKEWAGYLDDAYPLDGLDDKFANEYLEKIPIDNPDVRRAIIFAAKGQAFVGESNSQRNLRTALPFYLDLSVDTYLSIRASGREPQAADFGETHKDIFDRFLKHRTDAEKATLKILAAARSFDETLFVCLISKFFTGYPATEFAAMCGYSFVERGADGRYRLHALMQQHLYAELTDAQKVKVNEFLFGQFDSACVPSSVREIAPEHAFALNEAAHYRRTMSLEGFSQWIHERCDVFYKATQFAAIEPLFRLALEFDENSFGPEHPNVAIRLNNLAQLYQATNRLSEAEPLMKRALKIDENSFGPEHPRVAVQLNNLAQLYKATNRLAEAEPLMKRALTIDENSLGPEHPDVAIDLNNLAQLYQETNRLAEAEPLMKRALTIDENSFGPEHPDVAIDLSNLAALYHATNRLAEAEPLMKRALTIDENSFGPEHPHVAIDLNNLAQLYQATNRLAEAEPLMKRALTINENSFGPEHPKVAIRLNNLAQLYKATNRLAEAEPLMKRALKIDENSFGPEHPNVALRLNNLAQLYQATNRLAEAEPLLKRALTIHLASFGVEHPKTQIVLRNLNELQRLLAKDLGRK
jgi:tetratricopeptide (TPR) repeat protein